MTISPEDNLFGIGWTQQGGYLHVLTKEHEDLFMHAEHPHFDPYFGLTMSKEYADKLIEKYGTPKIIVMEQADTDGNGALDKVAVRYEGSKGTLEFETEYKQGWTAADHISEKI